MCRDMSQNVGAPKCDIDVLTLNRSQLAQTLRNESIRTDDSEGDRLLRIPTTGVAVCCARVANGQPAATPPISKMNSRRRMPAPHVIGRRPKVGFSDLIPNFLRMNQTHRSAPQKP